MIRIGQLVTHNGATQTVGNDVGELPIKHAERLYRRGELDLGNSNVSYPRITAKNRRDYVSPVLTKYLKENTQVSVTLQKYLR